MKLPSDQDWKAWAFRTSLLLPDTSFCTRCGSLFHQSSEHFIPMVEINGDSKAPGVRRDAIPARVPKRIR
jgi:hypothetical protein